MIDKYVKEEFDNDVSSGHKGVKLNYQSLVNQGYRAVETKDVQKLNDTLGNLESRFGQTKDIVKLSSCYESLKDSSYNKK